MPADDRRDRPLLNPVLTLRKEPAPEQPSTGGQGERGIVMERLDAQRAALAEEIERIAALPGLVSHAGKVHLVARMFEDSFAPSWTPKGLFDARFGCRLVAPARGGYLAEASANRLADFAGFIRTAAAIEPKVAISRVQSIQLFDTAQLLRGRSLDELWDAAAETEGGNAFALWLAPFRDNDARSSLLDTLGRLERDSVVLPSFPTILLSPGLPGVREAVPVIRREQSSLARAMRRYRNTGAARSFVVVPSRAALARIAASGASFRIDPVRRIEVTAPGIGAEPEPPIPNPAAQPIVAVVDGGLTARSYLPLEVWRAPPLVPDGQADSRHGNRVTSLVVHGHAWNNNLPLPALDCRVATIQAVPRSGANATPNPEQLVEYLRAVARAFPDARVWNLSFNEIAPEDDPELVSYLGHEIAALAREADILPVISIGNRQLGQSDRLCAPADCEAGLTVGGRTHDGTFAPAGPCAVSLRGPGPDGMLKPDLSWFSRLRMLGGAVETGSSYPTALTSGMAAHTFANLKEPSVDLVRALMINATELERHDPALGWGTPFHGHLPWACAPGSVTLAWHARLKPGFAYYWNEIPIPPELIQRGKLRGTGRLTAILAPIVSELGGPNYFATRLQVALQYLDGGRWKNLLGTMREGSASERRAREDLAKWHPIRRHICDFSRGRQFSGNTMRLHARVYTRDLFQFGIDSPQDLNEQEVAFVLTLSDGSDSEDIYNSMTQRLSTFVESAVLGQEIEISNE